MVVQEPMVDVVMETKEFPHAFVLLSEISKLEAFLNLVGVISSARTDLQTSTVTVLGFQCANAGCMNHEVVWLAELYNPQQSLQFLGLDLNSQFYVYQYLSNGKILVQEAFKISVDDQDLVVQPIGSWSATKSLTMTISNFWLRRSNLQGKMFSGATILVRACLSIFLPIP